MQNRDSLLIFLIGVTVFTIGLGPEFLGLDARFGMFAQEMLRNGPAFFPTTYGRPYPDYPATSTFLIYLVSLPFGKVTPFTAILPTAITSALILVVIYRIGAIYSRQWGLFAALLALFTIKFFNLSRSISTDQYTSLATALCFYLAYSAAVYNKRKRLWFIPLLFAASFAFRGPIGLVIPAAVVCAYYLFERNFKLFAVMALTTVILFFVCFKGLLLAAAYQGGTEFAERVWTMQMAGRVQDVSRHNPAYYWIDSFAEYAMVYPFAVIVVITNFKNIIKRQGADHRLLACLTVWMLVVLIGMSIPSTKKIRYVLPMIPAATLIASYMFIEPVQKGFLAGIKKIFVGFCAWFPIGAFIGIVVLWIIVKRHELPLQAYYIPTLFLMLVLAAAVRWSDRKLKEGIWHDMALTAIGAATFMAIAVGIEQPISYSRDCTGPFVRKVESVQKSGPRDIVFYKISADGDAVKFMVNIDKPLKPQFVKTPEALLGFKTSAYFIAVKENFDALPQDRVRVLDSGKISGNNCVVFTLVQ